MLILGNREDKLILILNKITIGNYYKYNSNKARITK